MTDTAHDDWARLSDEWRATSAPLSLEHVRERVRRQSRRLKWMAALEVTLTLVAAVFLVSGARAASTWDDWAIIGGLTVFSTVIWIFTIKNRRGLWSASGETLDAYVARMRLHEERNRAARTFTMRLALIGTILLLVLAATRWVDGGWHRPTWVALAGAVYLAVWGVVAWRTSPRSGASTG